MFEDRVDAAKQLVSVLQKKRVQADFVFAIPRGGVMVGDVVASSLNVPLSIIVIRKIGAPHNPELAIGAVEGEGFVYWDEKLIHALHISEKQKKALLEEKKYEQKERARLFGLRLPNLFRKRVLVVDDGVATGSTALLAAIFLRQKGAKTVLFAAPVIPKDTVKILKKEYREIYSISSPQEFMAVGEFYRAFPQVDDQDAIKLLEKHKSIKKVPA